MESSSRNNENFPLKGERAGFFGDSSAVKKFELGFGVAGEDETPSPAIRSETRDNMVVNLAGEFDKSLDGDFDMPDSKSEKFWFSGVFADLSSP